MQMKRQVGSAFKPFVYGAALESRRYTLGTILNDSPETIHLGRGKYYKPKTIQVDMSDISALDER